MSNILLDLCNYSFIKSMGINTIPTQKHELELIYIKESTEKYKINISKTKYFILHKILKMVTGHIEITNIDILLTFNIGLSVFF